MKRLAIAVVVLMLGILPAAAETTSTEPIRGATLDAMVREVLEWIDRNTVYSTSGSPENVFLDQTDIEIEEENFKHEGNNTASAEGSVIKFSGSYDPITKAVYLSSEWSGHTAGDWGILVHELVHYVQDTVGKKFECREDGELEAYVLSFDFLNDQLENQLPHAVRDFQAIREKQTECTPYSLPAAAENVTTQPVRGATLDLMVNRALGWITRNTEYAPSGSPEIVFLNQAEIEIEEEEYRREGIPTAWESGSDYKFSGSYDPNTKTIYLRYDWTGYTMIDLGGLVQKLVHYAQDKAGATFECREDKELEAYVLSFDFLNDMLDNQWPDAVPGLREAREKQNTCTPPSMPTATD